MLSTVHTVTWKNMTLLLWAGTTSAPVSPGGQGLWVADVLLIQEMRAEISHLSLGHKLRKHGWALERELSTGGASEVDTANRVLGSCRPI